MSLRFRLIAVVVVALAMSLALGGVVILVNASRSVGTEMRAALLVGHQTVAAGLGAMKDPADPLHGLAALVASFRGNRHLRVSLEGGPARLEASPVREHSPFGRAPGWFIRLVAVAPETDRVPVIIDGRGFGTLVIETDPRNEILEVWNALNGSVVVMALFCSLTILLIWLSTGQALRPLRGLAAAMERVGQGDYAIRVGDRLTPELARLRDSFNRMAARLAATDALNRRLNEQMLNLQEEERRDIARDLHDEIGPLLFAINVDVANMARLLGSASPKLPDEMAGHIQSIADAARRLQHDVRGMLGRLRPIGLAEFGLADALDGLIDFWRRRHPGIDYRVSISPACRALGDPIDTTIYRIVQESLNNAARHGNPTAITVAIDCGRKRETVIVKVADDGSGLRGRPELGYGLTGMEERARAIGGRLTIANRPGAGGLAVTAVLPCTGSPSLPARPSETATAAAR